MTGLLGKIRTRSVFLTTTSSHNKTSGCYAENDTDCDPGTISRGKYSKVLPLYRGESYYGGKRKFK